MEKSYKSDIEQQYVPSQIETASVEEKPTSKAFKIRSWGKKLLLSVETGGIERVSDEERQHNNTKVWNACTFW